MGREAGTWFYPLLGFISTMEYREIPPWLQHLAPVLGGVFIGVCILLPAYEFVSFFDPDLTRQTDLSVWAYVRQSWWEALTLNQPFKLMFYAVLGAVMGGWMARMAYKAATRRLEIEQLKAELDRDLEELIALGEGEHLEFKSTFRYDLKQDKVNKALETVIMKTLAGMMNSEGGTLLIGVDDEGHILGLDKDYQTLRRKDSDGFEQLLNSSIADKLGTAACEWVRILFHQHGEQEVCRVRVQAAPQPVYLKEGKETKFYLRTGAGTRAMDLQEAIDFIGKKWKK